MKNTLAKKITSAGALVAVAVFCVGASSFISIPRVASAAMTCTPTTTTVVSDPTVQIVGGGNAVATYDGNPAWTVSIPGATWIWDTALVTNVGVNETVNFTKTFSISGTPTNATLLVAADNTYSFAINGTTVSTDTTGRTYMYPAVPINVTSELVSGTNTITATVTNLALVGQTDPHLNPAGLLFSLTATSNTCVTTPTTGTLTVINDVVNTNGGTNTPADFTMNVAGTNVSNPSFPGSTTGTTVTLDPGTYSVTETNTAGYNQTFSADCSGTIAAGDQETCTVTNTDIASTGGSGGSTPPAVCDPTVNLLANGDFESPIITDPGLWQIFPNGTPGLGWTVGFVAPQTSTPGLELQSGYTPNTGLQYAELDGLQHPTTIYQDIPTIPGKQYELSFAFSPRPGTGPADNVLGVAFNGSSIATLTADGTIGLAKFNSLWTTYDYPDLLPTGMTTRIQFSDLGVDNGLGLGTFLDSTSFRCIGDATTNSGGGGSSTPTTGTITVIDDVVNANGGTNTPADFTINVAGTNVSNPSFAGSATGTAVNLDPGTYSVTETNTTGYTQVLSAGCSGTISAGGQETCTITNNDIASTNSGGGSGGTTTTNSTSTPSGISSGGSVSGGGTSDGGSATNDDSQGRVLGASTSCGLYLTKYLRYGYANDPNEVTKLQQFLDGTMQAGLPTTGLFDSATEAAVEKFQMLHANTVLAPWGISTPTGIVYLTTTTEINNLMCPALNLPIPSPLINFEFNPDPRVPQKL